VDFHPDTPAQLIAKESRNPVFPEIPEVPRYDSSDRCQAK